MSEPLADPYPVRLPPAQRTRLTTRAARRREPLAVLLRRYIDAGDMADSMAENNTAFPHPDDTDGPADTRTGQEN